MSAPFVWPVRVYYEDTDAGGVVYHSQYLNFMERARTEWLRHLGFAQTDLLTEHGVLFVVHSMQIAFQAPARFDDSLYIHSQLQTLGRGSFVCQQQILRDGRVLITASVKIACITAHTFKPTAIPAAVKTAMESE